jgi:Secretion system C-terminal sorting domain/Leucine Rich repeats (2 copies)/Leucine Rich Repeat
MRNIILVIYLLIISVNKSYSNDTLYIIPQSEFNELQNFYNSLGGENWDNNEGWTNLSATFSETNIPFGLVMRNTEIKNLNDDYVVYSSNVVEIIFSGTFFSGNNLVGTLPNLNLPDLIRLDLVGNEISGKIPNFDLPKLEHLWLYKNKLSGEIPNFDLPKLKQLDLLNNQLSGEIPNFNLLPRLQTLYLGGNQLTGRIPIFNYLNLFSLNLSRNQLTGEIPNFNFIQLRSLSLYNNNLTGEISDFNFPALGTIHLQNNLLSGKVPDFTENIWISQINLSGNLYTFEALETNIYDEIEYTYSPQDTILPIEYEDRELTVTVDGSANEYHWFLGDTKISSTTISSYRPEEEGVYHCEVTSVLLPNLTLSSGTINVLTVGIAVEEEDRNLYYLYNFPPYPQPASSEVKIPIYWRLGNPINSDNIKIYNNMGVEIIQENKIKIEESTSINGEVIWDASGVDSGIYFLEIRHGTSTKYVKILLE